MLAKASKRIKRQEWQNVSLINVTNKDELAEIGSVDRCLFFLSLSVIPSYQEVVKEWLGRMTDTGRFVIADTYNSNPGFYARAVELVARADISRESWKTLDEGCSSAVVEWQPSSWFLGGRFFVASATVLSKCDS